VYHFHARCSNLNVKLSKIDVVIAFTASAFCRAPSPRLKNDLEKGRDTVCEFYGSFSVQCEQTVLIGQERMKTSDEEGKYSRTHGRIAMNERLEKQATCKERATRNEHACSPGCQWITISTQYLTSLDIIYKRR
jgi:hypothetical protein